jgi:hypothetical protein
MAHNIEIQKWIYIACKKVRYIVIFWDISKHASVKSLLKMEAVFSVECLLASTTKYALQFNTLEHLNTKVESHPDLTPVDIDHECVWCVATIAATCSTGCQHTKTNECPSCLALVCRAGTRHRSNNPLRTQGTKGPCVTTTRLRESPNHQMLLPFLPNKVIRVT